MASISGFTADSIEVLNREEHLFDDVILGKELEKLFLNTALVFETPRCRESTPSSLASRKVCSLSGDFPAVTPLKAQIKPLNRKHQSEAENFLTQKGQNFSTPKEIFDALKFVGKCVDVELENKRACESDEVEGEINARLKQYHDILLFLSVKKNQLMGSFAGELDFALLHRKNKIGLETPQQ